MGENVLCYKATMHIFKSWKADGLISSGELSELEAELADEYSLQSSIYRERGDLLGNSNQKQPLCVQNL